MKQVIAVLSLVLPVFLIAVASGCYELPENRLLEFKEIPRFSSYEELVAAFKTAQETQYGSGGIRGLPVTAVPTAAQEKSAETGGTDDYSRTNIQVGGVDEADMVKTDGKYIYNFSKGRLVISDAYPVENAKILSVTELKDIYPQEMFVLGDKLMVFGQKQQAYFSELAIWPGYWSQRTIVLLYNISDRSAPKVEKETEFEGNYVSSRLIGKHAYFVITSWPEYGILYGAPAKTVEETTPLEGETQTAEKQNDIIPKMSVNGVESRIAEPEEIGYIYPVPAQNFLTIVSLDIDSGEMQKETIVASGENVFASPENIYIASTSWQARIVPLKMPSIVPETTEEKTIVMKFGLVGEKIGFVGKGEVPGHVLNQFSMDEFEGNFRIATTVGPRWGNTGQESQSTNNLYVLDMEMKIIGKLEALAPGETIYSARFMGKKAYMVTFKKVDPLFVIDLSNPASPAVLGKLKIPGYSDYLHPFDETHIIGIGKEAIESKQGDFAWYQGMKMAIFDVSDVSNPVEMHKLAIGDRGTDSFALQNHKAFLFDKQKELLVLPIMLAEIPADQKNKTVEELGFPPYGEPVFQGAFVYRVSLENGFEERGRITHTTAEEELKRGYYFGDDYTVKRALYIGNALYTLSENMIKANSLDTLQPLAEIVFPKKEETNPYPSEETWIK